MDQDNVRKTASATDRRVLSTVAATGKRHAVAITVVSTLVLAWGVREATAANINLTTTADERNSNGQCSLREAIINANNDNQSGSTDCTAGSGADTIVLQSMQTYILSRDANVGDENAADEDDLDITANSTVIIEGNNSRIERDTIVDCNLGSGNATGKFRILHVFNGGNLTLQDVTVRLGCADGSQVATDPTGGGVLLQPGGTLLVLRSQIRQNLAGAEGGGIAGLMATITIRDSLVSQNQSSSMGGSLGGGIVSGQGSTLTILRSTISDNLANGSGAAVGGGIWNNGDATIADSTISDNGADVAGGIYNIGQLALTNTTVSGNGSGSNAGIMNDGNGTVAASFVTIAKNGALTTGGIGNDNSANAFNIRNSIVGDNPGGNCSGLLTASGVNLDTDGTCSGFMQVTSAQLDLGPLANYGGPTQTHALLPGSVAIDGVPAGQCTDLNSAPVNADQRGVSRPQGPLCDVGAYEAIRGHSVSAIGHLGLALLAAALVGSGVFVIARRNS